MQKSRVTDHIEKVGRIMITDGGHHPADFAAQVTAEQIAPIGPSVTGKRLRAARNLQHDIADALEPIHQRVHDEATSVDPSAYLDEAIDAIENAAKGTDWEAHFTFLKVKPDWLDEHDAGIAAVGADNVDQAVIDGLYEHLSPEQEAAKKQYLRYLFVKDEVARNFATAQHVSIQVPKESN